MPDYMLTDHAAAACGCEIRRDEPMKLHTTFRIGGPADRFYIVKTVKQLSCMLGALHDSNTPYFVLGNGSNLLVSDQGIRRAVLSLSGDFRTVELIGGAAVRAGAAATLASVCAFARENCLTGLEFAWGIPGSVGGAAYMNAGAYGGEMKDVVRRVHSVSAGGIKGVAEGEALKFSYRKSRYTGTGDIITSVEYVLKPGSSTEISGKMEELMQRRKEKQPYDMPSAGSVFKRPEGAYAAALIEGCGLKGLTVGEAQVSPKHAGFIVNLGNASCGDVLQLIDRIRETVYREKGIQLECEVRMTE